MDPGDIEVMVEIALDEARDELIKGKSAPKRFVLIEGEEILPFGRDLDDDSPDLDDLREIGRLVTKVEKEPGRRRGPVEPGLGPAPLDKPRRLSQAWPYWSKALVVGATREICAELYEEIVKLRPKLTTPSTRAW
jgi:hypothetical protein